MQMRIKVTCIQCQDYLHGYVNSDINLAVPARKFWNYKLFIYYTLAYIKKINDDIMAWERIPQTDPLWWNQLVANWFRSQSDNKMQSFDF